MRKPVWGISTQFLCTNFDLSIFPTPSLPSNNLLAPCKDLFFWPPQVALPTVIQSPHRISPLPLLAPDPGGKQAGRKGQKLQGCHRISQEYRAAKGKRKKIKVIISNRPLFHSGALAGHSSPSPHQYGGWRNSSVDRQ